MNKFLTALAALALCPPTFAFSEDVNRHQPLFDAVNSVTSISLNKFECFEKSGFSGYYNRGDGKVVVCQDQRTKVGVQVEWTPNDLDTLRHEAHHLIQDCVSGEVADFSSSLYLDDVESSVRAIGGDKAARIVEVYNDFDNDTIEMEIEAFAVAEIVPPEKIAEVILKVCK